MGVDAQGEALASTVNGGSASKEGTNDVLEAVKEEQVRAEKDLKVKEEEEEKTQKAKVESAKEEVEANLAKVKEEEAETKKLDGKEAKKVVGDKEGVGEAVTKEKQAQERAVAALGKATEEPAEMAKQKKSSEEQVEAAKEEQLQAEKDLKVKEEE